MISRGRTLLGECAASAIVVFGVVGAGLPAAALDAVPVLSALMRTFVVALVVGAAIWTFGPRTGAQVHPLLTIASVASRRVSIADGLTRLGWQAVGAVVGALAASLVPAGAARADEGALSIRTFVVREFVLALVLLLVAWGAAGRSRRDAFPAALGIVAGLAYWIAGSTSAAHPFVLVTASWTNGRFGSAPRTALGVAAELCGTIAATVLARWLFRTPARVVLTYGLPSRRAPNEV